MVVHQDEAAGADVEQVMDEGTKGEGAGLKCPLAQLVSVDRAPLAVEWDHEDTLNGAEGELTGEELVDLVRIAHDRCRLGR